MARQKSKGSSEETLYHDAALAILAMVDPDNEDALADAACDYAAGVKLDAERLFDYALHLCGDCCK